MGDTDRKGIQDACRRHSGIKPKFEPELLMLIRGGEGMKRYYISQRTQPFFKRLVRASCPQAHTSPFASYTKQLGTFRHLGHIICFTVLGRIPHATPDNTVPKSMATDSLACPFGRSGLDASARILKGREATKGSALTDMARLDRFDKREIIDLLRRCTVDPELKILEPPADLSLSVSDVAMEPGIVCVKAGVRVGSLVTMILGVGPGIP